MDIFMVNFKVGKTVVVTDCLVKFGVKFVFRNCTLSRSISEFQAVWTCLVWERPPPALTPPPPTVLVLILQPVLWGQSSAAGVCTAVQLLFFPYFNCRVVALQCRLLSVVQHESP